MPFFFKRIDMAEFLCKSCYFPMEVTNNFKPAYDGIQWLNNEDDFKRWCSGTTGYQWWTLECVSLTKRVICTIECVWWWQVFFVNIY
jgi:hypothetical protein